MTQDINTTEENDAVDFEAADKLQQQYARRDRSKKKKEKRLQITPLTTRQKFFYGLGVILVLNMLSAYVLGGNQTTAVQRVLSAVPHQPSSFMVGVANFLLFALPTLCIYQLFVYFSNWSLSAYEKWKRNSLLLLAKIFDSLSFGVGVVAISAAYLFAMVSFLSINVYAMNFRLDNSPPVLITTKLIERIPSRSIKSPPTLVLKDWRTKGTNATVKVGDSKDVFDFQGQTVTFYLREGAFGWPYAVERKFAQMHLNSDLLQKTD